MLTSANRPTRIDSASKHIENRAQRVDPLLLALDERGDGRRLCVGEASGQVLERSLRGGAGADSGVREDPGSDGWLKLRSTGDADR